MANSVVWKDAFTKEQPPAARRQEHSEPHSEERWNTYKEKIIELYTDKDLTLRVVAAEMKATEGFEATVAQYRRQLASWNVYKYQKFSVKQLKCMIRLMLSRINEGKYKTAFRLYGKALESARVERTLLRKLEDNVIDFKSPSLKFVGSSKDFSPCGISPFTPYTPDAVSQRQLKGLILPKLDITYSKVEDLIPERIVFRSRDQILGTRILSFERRDSVGIKEICRGSDWTAICSHLDHRITSFEAHHIHSKADMGIFEVELSVLLHLKYALGNETFRVSSVQSQGSAPEDISSEDLHAILIYCLGCNGLSDYMVQVNGDEGGPGIQRELDRVVQLFEKDHILSETHQESVISRVLSTTYGENGHIDPRHLQLDVCPEVAVESPIQMALTPNLDPEYSSITTSNSPGVSTPDPISSIPFATTSVKSSGCYQVETANDNLRLSLVGSTSNTPNVRMFQIDTNDEHLRKQGGDHSNVPEYSLIEQRRFEEVFNEMVVDL